MPFIPSSVPKLPLSMEPSRGKMMKSDNPAPDSSHCGIANPVSQLGGSLCVVCDMVSKKTQYGALWFQRNILYSDVDNLNPCFCIFY